MQDYKERKSRKWEEEGSITVKSFAGESPVYLELKKQGRETGDKGKKDREGRLPGLERWPSNISATTIAIVSLHLQNFASGLATRPGRTILSDHVELQAKQPQVYHLRVPFFTESTTETLFESLGARSSPISLSLKFTLAEPYTSTLYRSIEVRIYEGSTKSYLGCGG